MNEYNVVREYGKIIAFNLSHNELMQEAIKTKAINKTFEILRAYNRGRITMNEAMLMLADGSIFE